MNRRVILKRAEDALFTGMVATLLGALVLAAIWSINGIVRSINWECIFK